MRQKIIWKDINEREAPREQEIKIQKRLRRLNKIWDSFNSSSRKREGIKLGKDNVWRDNGWEFSRTVSRQIQEFLWIQAM